jgi:hypothetical protein
LLVVEHMKRGTYQEETPANYCSSVDKKGASGMRGIEVTGASQHGGTRREKMVNDEARLFQYNSRNESSVVNGAQIKRLGR